MSNKDITTVINAISKLREVDDDEYSDGITLAVRIRSGVVTSMQVYAYSSLTRRHVDIDELERVDLFGFLGTHYGNGAEEKNYNLTVFTKRVITMIEKHYPNLHRIATIDEILADLSWQPQTSAILTMSPLLLHQLRTLRDDSNIAKLYILDAVTMVSAYLVTRFYTF